MEPNQHQITTTGVARGASETDIQELRDNFAEFFKNMYEAVDIPYHQLDFSTLSLDKMLLFISSMRTMVDGLPAVTSSTETHSSLSSFPETDASSVTASQGLGPRITGGRSTSIRGNDIDKTPIGNRIDTTFGSKPPLEEGDHATPSRPFKNQTLNPTEKLAPSLQNLRHRVGGSWRIGNIPVVSPATNNHLMSDSGLLPSDHPSSLGIQEEDEIHLASSLPPSIMATLSSSPPPIRRSARVLNLKREEASTSPAPAAYTPTPTTSRFLAPSIKPSTPTPTTRRHSIKPDNPKLSTAITIGSTIKKKVKKEENVDDGFQDTKPPAGSLIVAASGSTVRNRSLIGTIRVDGRVKHEREDTPSEIHSLSDTPGRIRPLDLTPSADGNTSVEEVLFHDKYSKKIKRKEFESVHGGSVFYDTKIVNSTEWCLGHCCDGVDGQHIIVYKQHFPHDHQFRPLQEGDRLAVFHFYEGVDNNMSSGAYNCRTGNRVDTINISGAGLRALLGNLVVRNEHKIFLTVLKVVPFDGPKGTRFTKGRAVLDVRCIDRILLPAGVDRFPSAPDQGKFPRVGRMTGIPDEYFVMNFKEECDVKHTESPSLNRRHKRSLDMQQSGSLVSSEPGSDIGTHTEVRIYGKKIRLFKDGDGEDRLVDGIVKKEDLGDF